MDLKGIGKTWAENIFSKFEAIYSEVDGIMSQEVAKMQSVGTNIKKAYNEVMQDLLPSSCMNSIEDKDSDKSEEKDLASIKVLDPLPVEDSRDFATVGSDSYQAALLIGSCNKDNLLPSTDLIPKSVSDVSLEYNGCVGDCEKLSALTEGDSVKEDSSLSKAPEFISLAAEVPQVRGLHHISETHYGASTKLFGTRLWMPPQSSDEVREEGFQQDGSEKESTTKSEMSLQTSVEVTEDSSQLDGSDKAFTTQSEMSPQTSVEYTEESFQQNGLKKQFTTTLEMSPQTYSAEVTEESSQQGGLDKDFNTQSEMSPQTSVKVTGQSSQLDGLDKACNTPLEMSPQTSVEVTEDEPQLEGWENYNDILDQIIGLNGECPSALPSSVFVASVLSFEDEVVDIEADPSNSLSVESNGMESSTCGHEEYNKQEELAAVTSSAEIGTYDDSITDESDDAISADKFDDVKLDDECIIVHSNEFFSATSKAGHRRSYKNKIQDAFASRKRSGKKEDYELLAMWCADIDAEESRRPPRSSPCTLFRKLDLNSFPNDDSDESDWEIL